MNQSEPAHFVAGGIAVILILIGLVLILGREKLHRLILWGGLFAMAGLYLAGAVIVAALGAPEHGDTSLTQSQHSNLDS